MRNPRPWLAALLSLLTLGLGHVYAGYPGLAVALLCLLEFVAMPFLGIMMHVAPRPILAVGLALPLALTIAVAVHAARVARQPTTRFLSRARVVSVCVVFSVGAGVIGLSVEWALHRYIGRPYRLPSGSMIPTLLIGDHLYSAPWAYRENGPQRGDVVVVRLARQGVRLYPYDRHPTLPSEDMIKRVVGVPGDVVELEGARLTVNGALATGPRLPEPFRDSQGRTLYAHEEALGSRAYRVLDDPLRARERLSHRVEPDRYFLAGDNRLHSHDSRHYGTVHRDDILGRASTIYWSWSFNGDWTDLVSPVVWWGLLRHETRWGRIGHVP